MERQAGKVVTPLAAFVPSCLMLVACVESFLGTKAEMQFYSTTGRAFVVVARSRLKAKDSGDSAEVWLVTPYMLRLLCPTNQSILI